MSVCLSVCLSVSNSHTLVWADRAKALPLVYLPKYQRHTYAKLDQQREETEARMEARLAEMKASLAPAPADPAIPEEHLTRLQTRLESLGHTAKLLNDEELSVRVGGSRG
jgi:hypothetical protein